MGRFIALFLAFYVGTQIVRSVSKKFKRYKVDKSDSAPDAMKHSPWQEGDVEDADYEEIEK